MNDAVDFATNIVMRDELRIKCGEFRARIVEFVKDYFGRIVVFEWDEIKVEGCYVGRTFETKIFEGIYTCGEIFVQDFIMQVHFGVI